MVEDPSGGPDTPAARNSCRAQALHFHRHIQKDSIRNAISPNRPSPFALFPQTLSEDAEILAIETAIRITKQAPFPANLSVEEQEEFTGKISDTMVFLARRMADLKSQTPAGLRAKLKYVCEDILTSTDGTSAAQLLRSVVRDLEDMETARATCHPPIAQSVTDLASSPSAAVTDGKQDAELLTLGARYIDVKTAIRDWPGTGDAPEPMWNEYWTLEEQICSSKAETFSGLAVQLRVIWHWDADTPEEHAFGAQPESSHERKVLWSIVERAKELGARASA